MNRSVAEALRKKDYVLWLETERENLNLLDEDELIDLHTRVRRARNKHLSKYPRRAAGHGTGARARGGGTSVDRRRHDRAEALEDALARVSRRLGIVAQEKADALRAERLAAGRAGSAGSDRRIAAVGDRVRHSRTGT